MVQPSLPYPSTRWFAPANLFAGGFFCLVAAQFFGPKFLAAGHVLVFVAIIGTFWQRGAAALEWRRWGSSAKALAAFLVIAALSIAANLPVVADPVDHLLKLRVFLLFLLVSAMPALVGRNLGVQWRRDSLVLAWLVPMVLAVFVGLCGWIAGESIVGEETRGGPGRISGFYSQVMTFANCLQFTVVTLAAMVFLPGLWRRTTRLPFWVAVGSIVVAAVGLYLTYTRGAVLGALVGLVVFGAMRSRRILAGILVLAIVAGAVAAFEGSRYVKIRYDPRINHWRAAALAAVERPLLGWGFRNFELQSAKLKERYGLPKDVSWKGGKRLPPSHLQRHAHNNLLEAFASTGVAGGVAFLAFCFCWWREAAASRHRAMLLPLIAAFFVSGLFENTFFDAEVLNCILLVWLGSQWLFAAEAGEEAQVGLPEIG
jgi:O-antigen ligase